MECKLLIVLCWLVATIQGEVHRRESHIESEDRIATFNQASAAANRAEPGFVLEQLIMRSTRPRPSHHASTVVELAPGKLMAAWFAGTYEGEPDVGIWTSTYDTRAGSWSEPAQVAAPAQRLPCWNPVLFKTAEGQLLLFFKRGRRPRNWQGFVLRSNDDGASWLPEEALPQGIVGPAKNKLVQRDDGALLSPTSDEGGKDGKLWTAWVEASGDGGRSWERHGPIELEGKIIQPSIWRGDDGVFRMVARTRGQKYLAFSTGGTQGLTWSKPRLTTVPCPNAGLDAAKLRDGRVLLVYNHSFKSGIPARAVLAVAMSPDDGQTWQRIMVLEDRDGEALEFSYPAIIQASDELVHITYTWMRRNIKHVVLDPSKLPMRDGSEAAAI